MITLIRNAEIFSPNNQGRCDVLLAGGRIETVSAGRLDLRGEGIEEIDADGLWLLPGFVDVLTHPCGGGGEGGFINRTPELDLDDFVRAGVTTPVGALGTDSVARSLEVLYGKTMQLRAQGLSALMYVGSYRMPPLTLTGDVARDLMLIDPVIGVGEVAVSDHRSAQPTVQELRRLGADVHLGGTLSGKRGVVFLHLGDGLPGLNPVEAVLDGSELPRRLFYPTHSNRNRRLFEQAVEFARKGGFIDITASTTPELIKAGDIPPLAALFEAIDSGAPQTRVSISSDAGGSLPVYRDGELVGIETAMPGVLLETLCEAVRNHAGRVEAVVAALTCNPAAALGLGSKGRIRPGADADLLLFDAKAAQLSGVLSGGRWLQRPERKG